MIRFVNPVCGIRSQDGVEWEIFSNICRESVNRTMPEASHDVFHYDKSVVSEIRLTPEGKGDYAKALASREFCSEGEPCVIVDADSLVVRKFDFSPKGTTELAMYEQKTVKDALHAGFHDVIVDIVEHAGFDVSDRIIVASWTLWTKVNLEPCWMKWYEFTRKLMFSSTVWERIGASPGIVIWNLVWYEFHREGKTEPLPAQLPSLHVERGLGPAMAHVFIYEDRLQGAKEAWELYFGEELPEKCLDLK